MLFKRGQAIYNYRCYFCHGYSGDANTLASTYLTPKPIAFTERSLDDLSPETMRQVISRGKANTAMMPFSSILSEQDIEALIVFVRRAFFVNNVATNKEASQKIENTRYHTIENGWPDHEQYSEAFPFVQGEIEINEASENLTAAQKRGKQLYLSGCITCHDRSQVGDEGIIWQSFPISWPRNAYSHKYEKQPDAISQASPFHLHDIKKIYKPDTKIERQGQKIFQENCAFCHAPDGSGKHWIGQFIEPHARDFTRESIQYIFTKQSLKESIRNGVKDSAMPAWRYVLSEQEVEFLVSFMWQRFK